MAGYRKRTLSATQRLEILERVREGYTHSHLASIYGVSRARVGQIANADESKVLEWIRVANLPELKPQNDPDDQND